MHNVGSPADLNHIISQIFRLRKSDWSKNLLNFEELKKNGKYAAIAPMAGVADSSFRALCMAHTAAFAVGEMVSAKGICFNDRKSKELMSIGQNERPCAIQLFGSVPEDMAKAAVYAMEFNPDFIDINMGCPAPKVANNGCGSALMKNPELAGKIIRAVVDAVNLPVSVKFRKGWDENSVNCVEFAKIAEYNGASFITVHGRTRKQMYAPSVDLDSIKNVKAAVSIPVIGNGDVISGETAKRMYEYTGCDFIMIGRGALGNPWIFDEVNAYMSKGKVLPFPTVEEKMQTMLRHAEDVCKMKGDRTGLCEMRKHALWYTKGLKGSAKLRNKFNVVSSMAELELLAEETIKSDKENK